MFRLLCNICPAVLQKMEVHHMPAVATGYSSVKQPLQKPQAALGAMRSRASTLRNPRVSAPTSRRISSTVWWQAMRSFLSGISVPK